MNGFRGGSSITAGACVIITRGTVTKNQAVGGNGVGPDGETFVVDWRLAKAIGVFNPELGVSEGTTDQPLRTS